MDHLLVQEIEKAFGWHGPQPLGRHVAHGRLADPHLPARLLTPTKLLDLVMRRSLVPPQFRCVREGTELHAREYVATLRTRRGQATSGIDMERLGRLLESGITAVLDAGDAFDPTLEVACRALQWWSGELVQVNAYLTTRDGTGFSLHWDDHDVIVVQLAGSKSWEVRGESRPAPMFRDAVPNVEPSPDVLWDGVLRRGDVLHIPRGYWHRATRAEHDPNYEFSLHVTFGLVQRTAVDWLLWVADQARLHEVFRRDLEQDAESGAAVEQNLALAEVLGRHIDSATTAEFLTSRRREQPSRRHVSTHGVFGSVNMVVCIAEFRPEVIVTDGSVVVAGCGRRVTFAPRAHGAVLMLLSGAPVSVAEVTAATAVDAGPIAEALVREGLCAEATDELCSGYTGLLTTGNCSTLL